MTVFFFVEAGPPKGACIAFFFYLEFWASFIDNPLGIVLPDRAEE
jgi:hypothetical protein